MRIDVLLVACALTLALAVALRPACPGSRYEIRYKTGNAFYCTSEYRENKNSITFYNARTGRLVILEREGLIINER